VSLVVRRLEGNHQDGGFMSDLSDSSGARAVAPSDAGLPLRDAGVEPPGQPKGVSRLSAWSVVAFGCFGLAIVANGICWAWLPAAEHSDPTGLGGLARLAAFYFSTMLPTLAGTVCGWVGLRRHPSRYRLALTGLLLIGVPCGLCLVAWLLLLVL
jgi:hypothetical protein